MGSIELEFARLLSWKRWAGGAAVLSAAGWVTAGNLATQAHGGTSGASFDTNLWDLPLEVLNNPSTVLFILVPLFVALVGDPAISDRWTGFVALSLPREGSRTKWWGAKVAAVLGASMLLAFMVVAVLLALGAIRLGLGSSLSEYGRAWPGSFHGAAAAAKSYGPPPLPRFAFLGVMAEASYTALAIAALSAVILAAAQVWPRPWTPLAITISLMLFLYHLPPTSVAHPALHLFWSAHVFVSDIAVAWWASGAFISLEVLVALVVGSVLVRRDM